MDCRRFEERLSDYFDGALAVDESNLFRRHALQCRSCRSLMDEVKAALEICKKQDDIDTPGALEMALVAISVDRSRFDCSSFQDFITEFLDGFVPASTYHQFEEHADSCDECSALLTGVVYAVAACHSVHTFEEIEAPESLIARAISVMPQGRRSVARIARDWLVGVAEHLVPRATQTARWTFATSVALALATFAFLLLGFSDDRTFAGVYRQAHVKASEVYSRGTDVYAQTDKVVARLESVGFGIGEFWNTLGGDTPSDPAHDEIQPRERDSNKRAQSNEKN
jgi:predicted anti-sigma-YlaC factor YlaD